MSNKRVLMVATVPSMIGQFNMNNIRILQDLGYTVDVAADFTDTSVWPTERIEKFKDQMKEMGIECLQLDFSRSPLKINRHINSYKETLKLLLVRQYSFIHTHTPIASAVVRLAAHKTGTKVIYTAHGFHFYDGAPLKNWIVFYPVEKFLSKWTDVLITINREDYNRAVKRFNAKKTVYVPGVGVDTEKFAPRRSGRNKIRTELGLNENRVMILSVGELNDNKNHESVIKAIAGLGHTYVIVGKGDLADHLEEVAKECNVDLRLMGFRTDVSDFYDAADVYVLPSIREGLNVSLMEAMASGIAVVCGSIRGNTDLIATSECLFNPKATEEIKLAVEYAINNREKLGLQNLQRIRSFDLNSVELLVSKIYRGGYEHLIAIINRQKKRLEIGVPIEAKLLISVGELSVRKNHGVVIKALQELPDDYWYVIIGKGDLKDELEGMDHTGKLKLIGFRTDVAELLHCSDLFVFPSIQEGLPVALMEAITSGIPCMGSNIRGNVDLLQCDEMNPSDYSVWRERIEKGVYCSLITDYNKLMELISLKNINVDMTNLYLNYAE